MSVTTTLPGIVIQEDPAGRNHKARAYCELNGCDWESATGAPPYVEDDAADHLTERHPRRAASHHRRQYLSYINWLREADPEKFGTERTMLMHHNPELLAEVLRYEALNIPASDGNQP